MVEEMIFNLSDFVSVLPLDIVESITGFIAILKAVGIFAIIYFVYMITIGILTFRRMKRINSIEEKVDVINKKINKLLKRKK